MRRLLERTITQITAVVGTMGGSSAGPIAAASSIRDEIMETGVRKMERKQDWTRGLTLALCVVLLILSFGQRRRISDLEQDV